MFGAGDVTALSDLGKLLAAKGMLSAAADVGVAEGRTALKWIEWGFEKVYLVDHWGQAPGITPDIGIAGEQHEAIYQLCLERLKGYESRYIVLRGWSHEMANHVPDESLDYVYVDASHDYESVKRDLEAWHPKLKLGAVMAGHDYSNLALGVKKAVDEFTGKLPAPVNLIAGATDVDASFWFEVPCRSSS